MSTNADIAASFFGNTTPTTQAPTTVTGNQRSEQSTADVMFGETTKAKVDTKASVKDVDINDDQEMSKVFHRDSPIFEDAKRSIANAAKEHALASPEEATEIAAKWEPTLQAYDLNATEGAQLTELGVSATINPVEPEVAEAWRGDAMKALRQEFGDKAGEALQAATAMIRSDRALVQFLEQTQLGNHPKFVVTAAKKAMARSKR